MLVGVIWPNGAGKSTYIKAIPGFVKRDVGSVRSLGIPAEKGKGLVAYVPQRGAVDWDFPIQVKEVAMLQEELLSEVYEGRLIFSELTKKM